MLITLPSSGDQSPDDGTQFGVSDFIDLLSPKAISTFTHKTLTVDICRNAWERLINNSGFAEMTV